MALIRRGGGECRLECCSTHLEELRTALQDSLCPLVADQDGTLERDALAASTRAGRAVSDDAGLQRDADIDAISAA